MTLELLNQLRPLEVLIERERERLEELRDAAGISSPRLDGMPRKPGVSDKVGSLVPAIIDQESEIMQNLQLYTQKKREIEQFINEIPQFRIRLIYQLYYRDGLNWQEVSDKLGGKETEYSVKNAAYRYLRSYNAWRKKDNQ